MGQYNRVEEGREMRAGEITIGEERRQASLIIKKRIPRGSFPVGRQLEGIVAQQTHPNHAKPEPRPRQMLAQAPHSGPIPAHLFLPRRGDAKPVAALRSTGSIPSSHASMGAGNEVMLPTLSLTSLSACEPVTPRMVVIREHGSSELDLLD